MALASTGSAKSFMTHPNIIGVTSMWLYQKEFADENKNVCRVTQNSTAFYILSLPV